MKRTDKLSIYTVSAGSFRVTFFYTFDYFPFASR